MRRPEEDIQTKEWKTVKIDSKMPLGANLNTKINNRGINPDHIHSNPAQLITNLSQGLNIRDNKFKI